jgi:outer membrane biogenesis lipoprotein LolB
MKTKIKYLLVLVLASFVLAGCCTMHSKTKQMEYKVDWIKASDANTQLNEYGKDGWKLVSVILQQDGVSAQYTFERPKH